jgi:hypothetical protein
LHYGFLVFDLSPIWGADMSGRPLSSITEDELTEIVNIARQEYEMLTKKFHVRRVGLTDDVVTHLAISVAVQAVGWKKRKLP